MHTKEICPKNIKNRQYHIIGAVVVILNYFRHMLSGYKTPRTFPSSEINKTVEYDLKIVDRWTSHLRNYTGEANPFQGKVVLELGVGPDLGTGAILLAMGGQKYFALDVHNLAEFASQEFYQCLFERIRKDFDYNVDFAEEQIRKNKKGEDSKLCYIVDKEFRISQIPDEVDVVVSSVAFEHFDDMERTIKEISNKTKKGGILIAHVDMNTHTRWIKERDPMNIYRYSELFWNTFKFRGSPNRMRIFQYKKLLEENAWTNITIEPRTILDEEYAKKVIPMLNRKFRDLDIPEMRTMSFMLISTKN